MKHAILSPSSSHRWITCPGSVALSKNEPKTTSTYSDEGTAAHHLAAECLNRDVNAEAFADMTIGLFDEDGERMFNPQQENE